MKEKLPNDRCIFSKGKGSFFLKEKAIFLKEKTIFSKIMLFF